MDDFSSVESSVQPTFSAPETGSNQVSSSHNELSASATDTTANIPQIDQNADDKVAEVSNDVPEWLNRTTFTNEDVESAIREQAKAYPELQKSSSRKIQELTDKLKGFSGSPEDGYEFTPNERLEEAGFEFDSKDPYFQDFVNICKEAGMNQEVFQQQMEKAANYLVNAQEQRATVINEAIEKQQAEELESLDKQTKDLFIENLHIAGNMKGVDPTALNNLVDALDASMIPAFNAIIGNAKTSAVPSMSNIVHDTKDSLRELNWKVEQMPEGPQKQLAREQMRDRYQKFYG